VEDEIMRLLGLARRAGALVVGTAGVRVALRRGNLELVVVAGDRSRRTEEKVVRLAHGKAVRVVSGPNAIELGRRLGRETVQAVGVIDPQLAKGIEAVSVPIGARRS
jgi:ribosomal protein L7Ae-like RNA K-turn-binding protein